MLFACREVPQPTTGFSPFELLYGREVRGPLDVLREVWEMSKKSDGSVLYHILLVREKLEMSEWVSENLKEHRSVRSFGMIRMLERVLELDEGY